MMWDLRFLKNLLFQHVDVVNVNTSLLLKRLKIIGLPADVIGLIEIWLEERSFYVSITGETSFLFDIISKIK